MKKNVKQKESLMKRPKIKKPSQVSVNVITLSEMHKKSQKK